jgi:hypothetical protein
MSENIKQRGQKDFPKDVIIGDDGEDTLISFLKSYGFTDINKNNSLDRVRLSEWDIEAWHNGKRWTFEVKADAMAADTGNICIEFARINLNGVQVPSGISVTTADFFVSIIPDFREIRIIYTSELKRVIEKDKHKLRVVPMGDGLRTRGYLMKIKEYEKYYRAIHKI